ncbi:hypothetical protein ZWY2020_057740, partial [Hordeum vulgare]
EVGHATWKVSEEFGFKWSCFEWCVPCYARAFLLDKVFVRYMEEVTQMTTYLKTKDGFNFKCTIHNEVGHTYFGCASWKGLTKAYHFELGLKITIHIGTYSLSDKDRWMDLGLMPILRPSYFLSRRNILNIVDDTYYTSHNMLTWQEKSYLVFFVAYIESLKDIYGAGRDEARYLPLVHTLNKGCVVPWVMDYHQGDMAVISAVKIYFRGTYLIALDVHVEINEWRQLVSICNLKIGDLWISVIHHGDIGVFLFFRIVP